MADYKKILIAGNPALTTDNMHPDHFGYLGGEKGYDGEKGAGGPGGQKGQTGPTGEKGTGGAGGEKGGGYETEATSF